MEQSLTDGQLIFLNFSQFFSIFNTALSNNKKRYIESFFTNRGENLTFQASLLFLRSQLRRQILHYVRVCNKKFILS